MEVLRQECDPSTFFAGLRQAVVRVLMLDYDGTLAPFRSQRDQALPYPGVRQQLAALQAAGHTRLVIVSGRRVAELLPLLSLHPPPELWGSHGWERLRGDGDYELAEIGEAARETLADAARWAQVNGYHDRCESKPASLAFHLRDLASDAAADLRRRVYAAWGPLAEAGGLTVHEFDGGVELRVPGRDKGTAVTTILSELGEGVQAAYLGDDRTDEDAFLALRGRGLAVLVRSTFRPTAADVWIKPPSGLRDFLAYWQQACTKEE